MQIVAEKKWNDLRIGYTGKKDQERLEQLGIPESVKPENILLNNQVENANALINNKYNEKGETKEIKYSHQPSEEIKGQYFMAKQYVLHRTSSLESRPGWCAPFGEYCGYSISVIEDEQQDIRVMLDHMDGEVVDTTTARGIIYADPKMTYDGATLQSETISIRSGTNVADAFPQLVDSGEAAKTVVTLDADAKSVSVAIQKVIFKKMIKDRFNQRWRILVGSTASALEKATWEAQKSVAAAWNANNSIDSADIPVLTKIATERGITVAALVGKIDTKVAPFNLACATELAKQQKLEDSVDACTTIQQLHTFRHTELGVSLREEQRVAEGVASSPATTKVNF